MIRNDIQVEDDFGNVLTVIVYEEQGNVTLSVTAPDVILLEKEQVYELLNTLFVSLVV